MKKTFLFLFVFSFLLLPGSIYAQNEEMYLEHTKEAIDKMSELTQKLNAFSQSMINGAGITVQQRESYDKMISDFESCLKDDPYIIYMLHHPNHVTAEYDYYLNFNGEPADVDASKWDPDISLGAFRGEEDDLYTLYRKAVRRYKINAVLYTNGYRNLAAYLEGYTKHPNGVYYLDGMKITKKSDTFVEIDLTDAEYIIRPGEPCEECTDEDFYKYGNVKYTDEDFYEYGYVKVISPKGNTYIFTGFAGLGDENGYLVPTGRGYVLNCEYNGDKEFFLNTENKTELVYFETIMLSDVFFNKYLKQSKTDWYYRGISFSSDKDGNYYITTPPHTICTGLSSNIKSEYLDGGSGESSRWPRLRSGYAGYAYDEFYWDTDSAVSVENAVDGDDYKITYSDNMIIHINRYDKTQYW